LEKTSWQRWLVPPVRDLIFVVLLFSICFGSLAQRVLRDGGTGWHIRTGQRILATHSVPRGDPFSLSTARRPWYAWEWLYDAALGAVYNRAGLNGAVAATGVLVAATFAWLFRIMRLRGTGLLAALVLLLLALAASAIHLYVRPHVVSWLLTLAWWVLLERARANSQPKLLLWLPVLMVFWVNVHGGFLFGFALLAIYCLDAVKRAWIAPESDVSKRWLRAVLLTAGACVVATLVNPYGYKLHVHIYRYLTDRFLMTHIQEFQPPGFRGLSEVCFVVLVVMGLAGFALVGKKPALPESLVALIAAIAGLSASRNLPVSSLLVAAIVGPYISRAWKERIQSGPGGGASGVVDRLGDQDAALQGGAWPVGAIALVLWAAIHGGAVGRVRLMDAQFDSARFPLAAVSYLRSKEINAPLFSTDQWGGYLIYQNYPAVLVDDRHDLYGAEFFKQYLKIMRVEPGWASALDGTRAELVLVPAGSPLAAALRQTRQWKEEYQDSVAVLFERAE
jgi:hypothetical protein